MSNAAKNQNEFMDGDNSAEMPTVTTLLRRKKLAATQSSQPSAPTNLPPAPVLVEATPSFESSTTTVTKSFSTPQAVSMAMPTPTLTSMRITGKTVRQPGEPPEFKSQLVTPRLDFKAFKKNLKTHKKSVNMKKLDCIGYFNMHFQEIAYFELDHAANFKGVVGFGNTQITRLTKQSFINPNACPTLSEMIAAGNAFVGAAEAFQQDTQKVLRELPFKAGASIGIFPVMKKKKIQGVWICASNQFVQMNAAELKELKKLFSDIF